MRACALRRERSRRGDRGKDLDPRERAFHHAMWAIVRSMGPTAAMTPGQGEPHCARRPAASSGSPVRMQNRLPARPRPKSNRSCSRCCTSTALWSAPSRVSVSAMGRTMRALGNPRTIGPVLPKANALSFSWSLQSQRGLRRARDHAIRSPREARHLPRPAGNSASAPGTPTTNAPVSAASVSLAQAAMRAGAHGADGPRRRGARAAAEDRPSTQAAPRRSSRSSARPRPRSGRTQSTSR